MIFLTPTDTIRFKLYLFYPVCCIFGRQFLYCYTVNYFLLSARSPARSAIDGHYAIVEFSMASIRLRVYRDGYMKRTGAAPHLPLLVSDLMRLYIRSWDMTLHDFLFPFPPSRPFFSLDMSSFLVWAFGVWDCTYQGARYIYPRTACIGYGTCKFPREAFSEDEIQKYNYTTFTLREINMLSSKIQLLFSVDMLLCLIFLVVLL